MDFTKKLGGKIILLFLILFPFGQIIRINLYFLGVRIPIHPIDLVAGGSLFWWVSGKLVKSRIEKQIMAFLFAAAFSYFFSFVLFGFDKFYVGGLYLLRLLAYASFFLLTATFVNKKRSKEILFNSLILVVIAVGVFGWIQYFLYPDIRTFTIWGWDDHLYRLFGTFLDPGYASLILVFGFLLSLVKYLETKNRHLLILLVFILVSIAFTYSRAGYLALLAGSLTIFSLKNKVKIIFPMVLVFVLIILFLPRPASEGTKLERLHSIYLRISNYSETIEIFKKSPVFGVGYNNLCLSRQKYLGRADFNSNACSGSDSSLLFILATTGVIGFLIFLNLIYTIVKNIKKDYYGYAFLACLGALLIHSFFLNSLFYPWIMGWMGILLHLSLKSEVKN